jgi:hypothetical protein
MTIELMTVLLRLLRERYQFILNLVHTEFSSY